MGQTLRVRRKKKFLYSNKDLKLKVLVKNKKCGGNENEFFFIDIAITASVQMCHWQCLASEAYFSLIPSVSGTFAAKSSSEILIRVNWCLIDAISEIIDRVFQ